MKTDKIMLKLKDVLIDNYIFLITVSTPIQPTSMI